ncbi:unnamed protein product [Heligmosomoides polygyrus]|uniref:EGF-like domain-containing protein n=1 Tax=Heligmosomoides polygyrus TaxID=6339 RepID=A0A3P8EEA4_HELPZ|nr:unnamed protein product [Heligmosomoides polygyrus]
MCVIFRCVGPAPTAVAAKCDSCVDQPCRNGARCETVSGRDYRCVCVAGYHGKNCEHEIDACYGHPCLNNAVCKVIQEGRFTCVCPKGFKGDYCEINIDDCEKNKCQNGAKCVDMVNSYRCECGLMFGGKYCEEKLEYCSKKLNPCLNGAGCRKDGAGYTCVMGFSGQFCELPPLSNDLYPNTAQCHSLSCGHGTCYTSEDTSEYECRCHEGYAGRKCDRIRSVGFHHLSSYIALEPWAVDKGNLTSGLLVYYGNKSFISAELYDGRIKIAFYIGNYPTSHMYSFATVNDGMPHRIEILVDGRKCSLSIDNHTVQSIENDGKLEMFSLDAKEYLYFGGLPPDLASQVKELFHVKEPRSFRGLITCNKEKFRRYHVEGDCRSVDMVKNAECAGYCGEGGVRPQRSVVLSVVTTLWPFFEVGSHKACTGQSS